MSARASAASVVNPPADSAADRHPVRVDATGVGERAGRGEAVGDVDDPPGALQLLAVGAPVAGGAAVVHVDDADPAAGPVLQPDGEHRHGRPGRAAVDDDEQRRELAVGTLVRPGGRVVERVRVAGLAVPVDGGERHRLGHRDRRRVEAEVAGRAQGGHGPVGGDPVDAGLGRRRAGHAEDRVVPVGAHRADRREPGVERGERAVDLADDQRVEPLRRAREHDPRVLEHGVPGPAQLPGGDPDLGVQDDERLGAVRGGPAVEVPPAGAVGQEGQRPVAVPGWLADRLARAAGDDHLAPVAQVAHPQDGVVPRHRGVVPGDPGQVVAVVGDPRGGDEVGAAARGPRASRVRGRRAGRSR